MTVPTITTSGELDELAATVREFARRRLPEPTLARAGRIRAAGPARAGWQRLCAELGLGGLLIEERYGGAGASLVEAGRVAEALGAALATVPFLASGVLAPSLLGAVAEQDAAGPAGELLTRLAAGSASAAVAWAGADPGSIPAAPIVPDGVRAAAASTANGAFRYVIDADLAEVIVLVGAAGQQIAVAAADALRITPRTAFDLTRGIAEVHATDAPVTVLAVGAAARQASARMLGAGRLILAAESAGGAGAALAGAIDYARQRIQFGREIGSFQAIKHLLADRQVDAEFALSVARAAITAEVSNDPRRAELLALASFYPADRFDHVAATAIQVYGGIGFTAECPAHLYRRRAEANRQLLGDPARARRDYVAAITAARDESAVGSAVQEVTA